MGHAEQIKDFVKEKYTTIAVQQDETMEESCGCGGCGCGSGVAVDFSEDYTDLQGYHPNADLGLGCGLPTEYAGIKAGDIVVDLGSGAGNDCFVARELTGAEGKVIGIDMTGAMIDKARKNADILGFNNVEFRMGEIEDLPVNDESVDVVISNCVMNLVPDKASAFKETYRILRQNGSFSISDVIVEGNLPAGLKTDAEMYAGCVAGALPLNEYLSIIEAAGFENMIVATKKPIFLPDAMLNYYLSEEDIKRFNDGEFGIYSVTVTAQKVEVCCKSGSDDMHACGCQ